MLKKRTILVLKSIQGQDTTEAIEKIDNFLLSLHKPHEFWGPNNKEVQYINDFEDMCAMIQLRHNINPKELSTLEFFKLLDTIKKDRPKQGHQGRRTAVKQR